VEEYAGERERGTRNCFMQKRSDVADRQNQGFKVVAFNNLCWERGERERETIEKKKGRMK